MSWSRVNVHGTYAVAAALVFPDMSGSCLDERLTDAIASICLFFPLFFCPTVLYFSFFDGSFVDSYLGSHQTCVRPELVRFDLDLILSLPMHMRREGLTSGWFVGFFLGQVGDMDADDLTVGATLSCRTPSQEFFPLRLADHPHDQLPGQLAKPHGGRVGRHLGTLTFSRLSSS